jgi:hypothetical protein
MFSLHSLLPFQLYSHSFSIMTYSPLSFKITNHLYYSQPITCIPISSHTTFNPNQIQSRHLPPSFYSFIKPINNNPLTTMAQQPQPQPQQGVNKTNPHFPSTSAHTNSWAPTPKRLTDVYESISIKESNFSVCHVL